MKRTRRKAAPQGRYRVEYRSGYAYAYRIEERGTGPTILDLALGRSLPRQRPESEPPVRFPPEVRRALAEKTKTGGNIEQDLIDALEHALCVPGLRQPVEASAARRMLARKYKALIGHLGKVQEILSSDDLFPEIQMYPTQFGIRELLTGAEERRASLQDCSPSGDTFREWEAGRRRNVAGTVLSVLETAGVPTGGERGGRIMNIVMDHFFGRSLKDTKRAMARHRKWWKGLNTEERGALLLRVRSGVPAK